LVRTKIGTVPYLNARPLVNYFSQTDEGRQCSIEIIEAAPSELAKLLESGEISVGLLSSIEVYRRPEFGFVPGIGIIADGAVESVRLFSKVPIDQVQTIALDLSSLTSVALLKIILAEKKQHCEFISMPPDAQKMLEKCDAALLIGDKGYRDYAIAPFTLDLGSVWKEQTQLPFVYALWVGEEASITPDLSLLLTKAIAESEAERHLTTVARAKHYLNDVMVYELGERETQALKLFGQRVQKLGLL
jgi:chorismate dehydratase